VNGPGNRELQRQADARLVRSAGLASVTVALTLVIIKIWAWLATGSVALLGSLADSGLDLLASTMTLIAVRFALEPADREHRFGHGKLEAIAGLAQSFVILASAAYVGLEAVVRLIEPAPVEAPFVGIVVMLISLGLTILLVTYQNYVVRQTSSLAISADALHYRADVFMNLAVLVAIGMSSWLGWYRADPILGLLVVLIILASIRAIVLQALDVLLDRELPVEVRTKILAIAHRHEAVLGVHDLRTRTSGTHEFIQFHLELRPEIKLTRAHEICDEVETAVKQDFPRADVMIHADPFGLDEPQDAF
jgi:ferrous-iron efflux pump FieF